MDLTALRSTIEQHRRPSGRVTIGSPLRAQILEVYAAWRENEGSQKDFIDALGLKASTFASWLAMTKSSNQGASVPASSLDGFRKVNLSSGTKNRAKLSFVLPNGARLKGLSLKQALTLLERFS